MALLPSDIPPSFAGNRIGLLGGTFNPPHEGHVDASLAAIKRLQLDRVWWLVTPGNPLKNNDDLPSIDERVDWCRRLIADNRIIVTDFERHLEDAFTAHTVQHLVRQRPTTQFVWLMGGDALVHFHHWYHWQGIIDTLPIAIVDRPLWRLPALASKTAHAYRSVQLPEQYAPLLCELQAPAWTYITAPQNDVSSSDLRRSFRT